MAAILKDSAHVVYIQTLRRMTPEAKLLKSFELYDFAKECFLHGLRKRFPAATDDEIMVIYLDRIERCHNRNY
ncbi:MAG: hypothetical protein PHP64_01365 [Actinomycetota bacterium]|nr:hypothetical protein [Actinomycetota bacterium]